ncbi:acyl-CoA dehydrogenase [freshwater metagenome]|uniref:Acyl-CoA dehydrogenase n=1 Tax=freshwater metagenome TaxID=449393 RepID=A0A094SIZ9_9ZZZZ
MTIQLTQDQKDFQEAIRAFVDKEIIPVARDMEHSGEYPTAIVEHMKEMGLFGMTIPEEFGGLSVDMTTFSIVFEELSRGWMGVAGVLGSHSMACFIISKHGTPEQKAKYLPELATGARRSGLGLTEPGAGTDLQGITTTATLDGDHYIVRGSKTWITNARHADPLPVLVKTDPKADPRHKGMSVLLIDAGTPGFTIGKDIPKMGYKGPESCEVILDEVRVPVENLLGGVEGRGMQQVLSALETGRLNIAARSVGIAARAYEEAVKYAKSRMAFGKSISEFQAIQLKIADMATDLQAARLLTYWAASEADQGKRVDLQTAQAKVFASEVAIQNSLRAMQVHGGYGYSTEYEIERLYRDAPLMSIGEGTNDIMRMVIAKQIFAD